MPMSFAPQSYLPINTMSMAQPAFINPFAKAQPEVQFHENTSNAIENVKNLFVNLKNKVPSSQISTGSNMLNYEQLIAYKTLPCPNPERCSCKPREVVTKNQYNDKEYQCPFYHHNKDQRRPVLAFGGDDDFAYQANYFDSKATGQPQNYSNNYFESMFHPLYYKMFQCKRIYCKQSAFCPFFHNEEEKSNWSELFKEGLGRDRVEYVKDKKKYYEGNENSAKKDIRSRLVVDKKLKQTALAFTPNKTTTTEDVTTQFFEFSPSNSSTRANSNSPREAFEELSFSKRFASLNASSPREEFNFVKKSESVPEKQYNQWQPFSPEVKNVIQNLLSEIFIN